MRVKKCIKYLLFSITLLLCCVSFSKDANAAVLDLGSFDIVKNVAAPIMQPCFTVNCPSWGSNTYNVKVQQSDLFSIRSVETFDMKQGDYMEYLVEVRQDFDPVLSTAYSRILTQVGLLNQAGTRTVQYQDVFDSSYDYNYQLTYNCASSSGSLCSQYTARTTDTGYTYKVFQVTTTAISDGERVLQMGGGSSFALKFKFGDFSNPSSTRPMNIRILNATQYRPKENPAKELNDKDDEDRSNIESQSSEADSDSSSSSEQASQQGTTLLGAFTAFVSALTNASPSNCRLLLDIGRFEAGSVDLCSLDPPSGFSVIASIFLIIFCVPLSVATAKKVISLFRSFQ